MQVEARSSDSSGCRLLTSLSWDNGTTYTSEVTIDLPNVDTVFTLGGVNDDWGRVWSPVEFENASFVVKVRNDDPGGSCTDGSTTFLDHIQVRVTYRTMASGTTNPTLQPGACNKADFNFVIDMSGSIGPQGTVAQNEETVPDPQAAVPSNLPDLQAGITGFVNRLPERRW